MDKLIKPFLGILFLMAFGFKSYGQRHFSPEQPRYPIREKRVPVQRYNPAYVRPYSSAIRQPAPVRRIEVVKEAYIGRQLNLSAGQSRRFWPIYRQYVEEQTAVRILKRENNSNNSPNGTEQIDNELKYETELLNIRKHYRDEFLKILTPRQLSIMYKSERAFNDEVLRQLSERSVRAGN